MAVQRIAPADNVSREELESLHAAAQDSATPDELLDAALWASGVQESAEHARLKTRAHALADRWRPRISLETEESARARALAMLLHAELFRSYAREQTYVDVVFDSGFYDCESAALVFLVMGRLLGLHVEPALAPEHALVLVATADERNVEIEPTARDGLAPGPEDSRKFLRERGLPEAELAPARKVAPALLVGRVVLQRLAFAHDGEAPEGTPEEARLQGVWRALERRVALLAPSDRLVARTQAVRLERGAVRLVNDGRFEDGMLLQSAAVQLSGDSGVESERAFGNLKWAAWKRIEQAVRRNDFAAADRALAEAQATIGCTTRAEQCAEVQRQARETFWAEAIGRDKGGRRAEVWPLVEALLERFPDPGRHENQLYFALAESDRRWDAGDRDGADSLLHSEIERYGCEGELRRSCAEAANHAAFLWFKADLSRAVAWAREAYGYDPEAHGVRENYSAALHNEALRLVARQECAQARALAAELAKAHAQQPGLADAVSRCRER